MVYFQLVSDLVSSFSKQIIFACKDTLIGVTRHANYSSFLSYAELVNRYNKSLLGDNLGKFPAPFLMNTVHFAMQAALSNFITWFWSHRFQTGVTMSWRDYLWRG